MFVMDKIAYLRPVADGVVSGMPPTPCRPLHTAHDMPPGTYSRRVVAQYFANMNLCIIGNIIGNHAI